MGLAITLTLTLTLTLTVTLTLPRGRGRLQARQGVASRERLVSGWLVGRRPGLRAAWSTWLTIAARGLAVARLRCAARLRRRVGALHTWRHAAACLHEVSS